MLISFIIVNYNTKDLLDECLSNLINLQIDKEIIVVENGSSDGSADMVKQKYIGSVKLIETQNNGLAVGHNLGLKEATGSYIIYLGTDAFPTSDAISTLTNYMESHPDVGVATPKLVLRSGEPDIDAHRGFPTPWSALTHFSYLDRVFKTSRIFSQYYLGYKDFTREQEIDLCISHFMMVRKSVHEKIGVWYEDYFVFGEDVDFCYRAKEAGYKIMYVPQAEVLHYKGATVGRKTTSDIKTAANSSKTVKKKMAAETTRAMGLFYKKHYSKKYPKLLTSLVLVGITLLSRIRSGLAQLKSL